MQICGCGNIIQMHKNENVTNTYKSNYLTSGSLLDWQQHET
jgi:hypothetical protein